MDSASREIPMTYGAVVDCETLEVLKQIQTVRKLVSNNLLRLKLFEMKQKVFHRNQIDRDQATADREHVR